jgi:Carboxypeptidase regulatory-like domain
MLTMRRFQVIGVVVLSTAVFFAFNVRLAAQQTTGTIQGTVSDSTGGVIPAASVQVKNSGTGQTQATESDAQGRYRVPDLAVGDYEVQASKTGFTTVIHRGITLSVGGEQVVDFSMSVGQVAQTVTVEGEVSQVETTSSQISSLVSPTQMRELPLNGRNFEQLIQLAPGVQNYYAGSSSVAGSQGANVRQGRDPAISVAGSRPEGAALLMDDQSLATFYNRGIGSLTGTSLGVDAIAEFQMLTNTYGAQFGGNGAVMNSVSRSGTNSFHGSLFEFLRNSGMDARNFNDPSTVPTFRRNQYGGTFGGPIKKDKLFFFVNYEGLDYVQGVSNIATVPLTRTSTSTVPATAAAINALLALYPQPTFNIKPAFAVVNGQNVNVGTGQTTVVANNTALENYLLGRIDYTISDKDSVFGRYFIDRQHAVYPFSGGGATGLWGENDSGHNQFFNLEERHIFSPTKINTLRAGYSRVLVRGVATNSFSAMQFFPGSGRADGSITVGNGALSVIGTTAAAPQPEAQLQNRFSFGDDFSWTHGAHNFRFGGGLERVQSQTLWPFQAGGAWVFNSVASLLAGTALQVTGTLNIPSNNPVRNFRELDFAIYAQDDWRVLPRLTLNLGLRYEPALNPSEAQNNLYNIVNVYTDKSFSNVPHVFRTNASLKNIDPRIGFAWDLFGDHKTAMRGGFGIFHDVLFAGEYAIGYINSPPWSVIQQQNPTFPTLFTGAATPNLTLSPGWEWNDNRTPYLIEYNVNIERQLPWGIVGSIGYVGSHGVDNFSLVEENPVPGTMVNGTFVFSCGPITAGVPTTCTNAGRRNPALGTVSVAVNGSTSRYNSLQASLNRVVARNIQAQASYTFSKCTSDGDATLATLSGNAPSNYENPYDRSYDQALCGFNVSHTFRLNMLGNLPFHGNRFIEGWQLSGILAANTGLPFNVIDGVDQSNQINATNFPRPNYTPNNPAVTVGGISYPACDNHPIIGTAAMWFNPNCFTPQPFGTLGNFGREGLIGPGLVNVDAGVLKTTKIRESMDLQFRAEFFNLLNRTNLSLPFASLFQGNPGPTATLTRASNAGQIPTPAVPSREIQLGLKLIF